MQLRILLTSELQAKRACDDAFKFGKGTWAHIMIEEAAEVVDAVTDEDRVTELIQLATVCMGWVEAIESRTGERA